MCYDEAEFVKQKRRRIDDYDNAYGGGIAGSGNSGGVFSEKPAGSMREILILPNVFLALRLCGPVDNDQGPISRIGGDGADKPDYVVSLEPLPVKGNAR